jgi:hypothetical protein
MSKKSVNAALLGTSQLSNNRAAVANNDVTFLVLLRCHVLVERLRGPKGAADQ